MNEKTLKPFDLDKARQGAKLVTRDGRPARIICWDLKCEEYPIVALVMDKDGTEEKEEIETFTLDGECVEGEKYPFDLFMAPTTVERWVNVYKKENEYYYGRYYGSEQEALENYQEYQNAKYIATAKLSWEE